MRISDYETALKFYVDWLGFTFDHGSWESTEDNPGSITLSLDGIVLRLTTDEYYGRGIGVDICDFKGLREYYDQLVSVLFDHDPEDLGLLKEYYDELIDLERTPADYDHKFLMEDCFLKITDPFGNRLTFSEPLETND